MTQFLNRKLTEFAKTETFLKLAKEDNVSFLSSDEIQIENKTASSYSFSIVISFLKTETVTLLKMYEDKHTKR